ncbi:MAG: stage sporulation protein, partial [Glaciihabitans sp.]|nr:stage sporulation protein [Glaciihabitans sp.]
MSSFKQMDLDAYSAAHREEWDRLAQLGKKGRYTGAEADELIERYQSGATQLSAIKTTSGQSVQGERLSLALSRARLRFTGASSNALSQLPAFFVYQLPAALYRVRWLSLAAALGFAIVAFLYAWWLTSNPQLLLNFGSDAELRDYAEQQFVGYYSNNAEGSFAGQVWTNNAWIAAQCIAFGITAVWAPYMVFQNGQG